MLPFWNSLKDREYGGFYGLVDDNLRVFKRTEKGMIENSRILWFFSQANLHFHDQLSLADARHAFAFMTGCGIDRQEGGIVWSVSFDGQLLDGTKSAFNLSFAITGLCSYYQASHDEKAKVLALQLEAILLAYFKDGNKGYKETLNRFFAENSATLLKMQKSAHSGQKSLQTQLHVLEAFDSLQKIAPTPKRKQEMEELCSLFSSMQDADGRFAIFFDEELHVINDYRSYGHDIETAWLLASLSEELTPSVHQEMERLSDKAITNCFKEAYQMHSLIDDASFPHLRPHWPQAEAVVAFLQMAERHPSEPQYLEVAKDIWSFITTYLVDNRPQSEWIYAVTDQGNPVKGQPIVWPWKGPYNNARMCFFMLDH